MLAEGLSKLLFKNAVLLLRDPSCKNGGEMAGPVARYVGCQPRRPLGYEKGFC